MDGLIFCKIVEKSCITGSLFLLCFNHRLQTCGYDNKSIHDKLQNRLEKSDFLNRVVFDLRKTESIKSNCL